MKVGMRTPSPTRSLKAKTTGRVNRAVKKSVNPVYGHKGVGYIKDPERAIKNKIYHKVTYDPLKPMKDAQWPEEQRTPSSSFTAYRFFMSVLAIASLYMGLKCLYRLIAYYELHLIPAIGSIILIIVVIIMKHYDR